MYLNVVGNLILGMVGNSKAIKESRKKEGSSVRVDDACHDQQTCIDLDLASRP